MIVVSNTSPVTNLAVIGQFELLHQLYARVHIAEGVWDELNARGLPWSGSKLVATAEWVERHAVKNEPLVAALRRDLDRGEAERIALALELEADLVLMDEREGRHAAQRMGLQVVGLVGVLLEARARGAIGTVGPHLDGLRQRAGFYLSETVYRRALVLAGEAEE